MPNSRGGEEVKVVDKVTVLLQAALAHEAGLLTDPQLRVRVVLAGCVHPVSQASGDVLLGLACLQLLKLTQGCNAAALELAIRVGQRPGLGSLMQKAFEVMR